MVTNKIRVAACALAFSASGFAYLVSHEGWCGTACVPVKGDVPTLGFGNTDGVKMGDTITPPAAVALSVRTITKFEGAVQQCVHVPLFQHEYDAYVSLAYNIGSDAFCNSTLVRELNQQHYAAACAEISRWDKFKGKPLRGLTVRRGEERAMCEGKR